MRRIVAIAFVAWVAGTAPVRGDAPASIPRWDAFGDPRVYTIGVALVAMMYVVVYQTHLILIAVAKLRHH